MVRPPKPKPPCVPGSQADRARKAREQRRAAVAETSDRELVEELRRRGWRCRLERWWERVGQCVREGRPGCL